LSKAGKASEAIAAYCRIVELWAASAPAHNDLV
jgi:hypothetical protein